MKIRVVNEPWNDSLSVLLYEDNGRERYVVKPIDLNMEVAKEGTIIEPTFRIPRGNTQDFLKSMAEMAESFGIKTDTQLKQEQKYEGKFEATQYHLEDMRKLVFKKDEPKQSEEQ